MQGCIIQVVCYKLVTKCIALIRGPPFILHFAKTILKSGFSTESEFRLEPSVEPGKIDDRAVMG